MKQPKVYEKVVHTSMILPPVRSKRDKIIFNSSGHEAILIPIINLHTLLREPSLYLLHVSDLLCRVNRIEIRLLNV